MKISLRKKKPHVELQEEEQVESPTIDPNEIDPNFPEALELPKEGHFTIRKAVGRVIVVVLTVGALIAYIPFFTNRTDPAHEFEATHTYLMETYSSLLFRKYPNEEGYKALVSERNETLDRLVVNADARKEIIAEDVISSSVTNVQVMEIKALDATKNMNLLDMYQASMRLLYRYELVEQAAEFSDPVSTTYSKVLELVVTYYFKDDQVAIVNRQIVFAPDAPLLEENKKESLTATQVPIIEGDPIDAAIREKTIAQLKIFFDTLSVDELEAQKLVKEGVNIPHYYHGVFDTEHLWLEGKMWEEDVKVLHVKIPYIAQGFSLEKVFVIKMTDNTITELIEVGGIKK